MIGQFHWPLGFMCVTSKPHIIIHREREDTAIQALKQGMGIRTFNFSFHGVALYQVQIWSGSTFLGEIYALSAEIHYQEHVYTQVMASWRQT